MSVKAEQKKGSRSDSFAGEPLICHLIKFKIFFLNEEGKVTGGIKIKQSAYFPNHCLRVYDDSF